MLSSSRTIIAHAPTRVNLAPTMETIGVGDISVPRSSPLALQTLRDMASISAALREMQQTVRPMAEHGLPAQQAELLATLNAGVGELQTSVAALQSVADGANVSEPNDGPQPEDVATLRAQAQRLQRETQSQSQVLLLLEEQESGSPERAQEVFSLMDVNNDGQVSEDEFLRGMTALLTLGKGETELLRKDVAERFRKATPDAPGGTGTMDFALFCDFLASLKGDAIGPLRVNLADALRRLLDNSLQMTSLSLSKELASPDLPPDRVRELSDYVDTWVELEGRATAAIAKGSTDPVQVTRALDPPPPPAYALDTGCTLTHLTGSPHRRRYGAAPCSAPRRIAHPRLPPPASHLSASRLPPPTSPPPAFRLPPLRLPPPRLPPLRLGSPGRDPSRQVWPRCTPMRRPCCRRWVRSPPRSRCPLRAVMWGAPSTRERASSRARCSRRSSSFAPRSPSAGVGCASPGRTCSRWASCSAPPQVASPA